MRPANNAEENRASRFYDEAPRMGNRSISSRDEMNLAEFPLAVLSTRSNPNVKTLEFVDTHRHKNGELVERKWIITGADKFGLPTSTDDDVVLGLICLTMDKGFRERKVFFTRYELLKILRWTTEGRSYSRLIKSLDRLSGVRIRAANAFYDNSSKNYQTVNFGLIDAYEIIDERASSRQGINEDKSQSYFIWSEVLFNSFKAGFIKKIDLDFYFSLSGAVSRRLYRYLDKHFYYKTSIEKPLMALAFDKLGLSRTYKYVSSVKQQIIPAIEELIKAGFLASYEFSGSGIGTTIRFNSASNNSAPVNKLVQSEEGKTEITLQNNYSQELITKLVARGLNKVQVENLLVNKSEEELNKIPLIINYYDHWMTTEESKGARSPLGFLYRAIESPLSFKLPVEFDTTRSKIGRLRPEHKVFKSVTTQINKQNSNSQSQKNYKDFVSRQLEIYKQKLGLEEIKKIYSKVEEKTSCLKTVLDTHHYHEAVEGCVKQQLIKDLNIPSFENWESAVKAS